MLPVEIVPGLLRWTAPHPDWKPDAEPGGSGDWDEMVGSVLYELPDTVVLIDPLLPSQGREEFLHCLDARVDARPVSILTTIRWHRRDREQLAQRYSANTTRAWNVLPKGVKQWPLRGAGETLYWLGAPATLVSGDRLITIDGRLAVCPESWLSKVALDRRGVAAELRELLELPVERVLVSHGEPVLHDGRAALAHAVAEAEGR